MKEKIFHISLLFNANKIYDREVIKGIGTYLQKKQCVWDIYLNEDFLAHPDQIPLLESDGIIADMDDPEIVLQLSHLTIPVIGVGSSYQDVSKYPPFPYIATNNQLIIECAYQHLKNKGLESFGFYGLDRTQRKGWAIEREQIFKKIMLEKGYPYDVFLGQPTNPMTWKSSLAELSDWLLSLPHPTGIIAVTDARARMLLQACEHSELFVPNQLAIIGIDNEDLTQYLTRIPLSSVQQDGVKMGYDAAKLLDQALSKPFNRSFHTTFEHKTIPPIGVIERQSSAYQAISDPIIIQVMHYIYQNALNGIKVEQVADAIGLSRSYLDTKFKAHMKITIHDAIHQFKREYAEKLIKDTDLPFKEIAIQSGYHSVQYLYSVFSDYYALTPKQYRELHKDGKIKLS